jgi:hypothetical protein
MLKHRFKVINSAKLKKNFFSKTAISYTVIENFVRERVQSLKGTQE